MEQEMTLEVTAVEAPKDQYLIFSVDKELFGIDINYVTEIIGMEIITVVPDLPDFIRGVINLRGKVVPVLDVRIRFQKEPITYTDRTCIIVVEIESVFIGLIIDEVLEVTRIEENDIMPPPKSGKDREDITNLYIWGVVKSEDSVKLLIDAKKLIERR